MLSGKAKLAGVMGWPVSHSLSPRLHGFWLAEHGIDGAYLPLAVSPENFDDALRALPKLGFRGANITVPHKEAALRVVDAVDPVAARIGAVNTVVVREDGSLFGANTDGFGFIENLKQGSPDWQPGAGPAVVLGAGGAARGVCVALMDAGVPSIRLTNRSKDRADVLAAELGDRVEVIDWAARAGSLEGASLVVNTTSLGMTGLPPLDLTLEALPSTALVTDIVYNPLRTDLLVRAQAQGNQIVDGLGMLLHQARPGFEAWFGVPPVVTPGLRTFVLGGLG